ncbi:MAG TPA: SdiA-regulated domain-containing protein [Rubricoccaceae bacterium]|nr:SdiA-regulated domain-containing protein [Rubricoccaceae bacterium]
MPFRCPRPLLGLLFGAALLGGAPACANGSTEPNTPPGADSTGTDSTGRAASSPVPYRFDRPDAVFALPRALFEISGLTVLADGRLGAVQDEQGTLYVLDPASGAVVDERRFAGRGDFESLERVGGSVWVLMADGTLLELADSTGAVTEVDTPLENKNDTEGLAYDAAHHRLLIACKEDAGEGVPDTVKAIYAFDLASRAFDPRPAYLLSRRGLDDGQDAFKPSALAVHPQTGQLYVLSSVRKALAIVEPDGRQATLVPLPEAYFRQPEGIAFLPDGTLFLSNEARGETPTLLRYRPQP